MNGGDIVNLEWRTGVRIMTILTQFQILTRIRCFPCMLSFIFFLLLSSFSILLPNLFLIISGFCSNHFHVHMIHIQFTYVTSVHSYLVYLCMLFQSLELILLLLYWYSTLTLALLSTSSLLSFIRLHRSLFWTPADSVSIFGPSDFWLSWWLGSQ